MSDDRLHRAAPDAGNSALPRWARAVGLGSAPRLPHPRPPRLEPVRRSWLGAFWQARIGVQSGMSLDDFLRSRLARYLASLPVPRGRLPLVIAVEDGQLHVTAATSPPFAVSPPSPEGCDAWLAPLVAVEGPSVRQEVAELEIRIATLDGEIDTARRRAEERGRQLAADIAAGLVAEPPDVEATAEQLGRPPIRSGAPRALALGFAAAALAAETWQVAQPLLRSAGVDPATLRAETARRPAEVVFAAIFALAVGTGIFALAHAALAAALELFHGDGDDRRRRWLASAALGAGLLAALVAAAVASLPGPAARPPAPAFVLLLVAVPLAAALVHRAAGREDEQRALELAAALTWDRERARSLAERARRLEELAWAEEEARLVERHRDAARRRLRELNVRAVAAARIAAQAEERERAALARVAEGLVGALDLDRYEFVRQASAHGAHDLIAPRRRKVPDAPSPIGPDGTTEPQIQPAGRLAS